VGPPHDQHTFDEYLRWLHRSMRTHIKPSYTEEAIDEDDEEDVIEDVYDIATGATHNYREPRFKDTW
jgi:hypothetical protein